MPAEGIVNPALIDHAVQYTQTPGSNGANGSFDPDMFLKILLSQLQNQSPFDTVDSQQILEQQAILTQVEQSARQTASMQDLTESVNILLSGIYDQIKEIKDKL